MLAKQEHLLRNSFHFYDMEVAYKDGVLFCTACEAKFNNGRPGQTLWFENSDIEIIDLLAHAEFRPHFHALSRLYTQLDVNVS